MPALPLTTVRPDVPRPDLFWGGDELRMRFSFDAEGHPRLLSWGGVAEIAFAQAPPLAEVVTTTRSKRSGARYDRTDIGLALRYLHHTTAREGAAEHLYLTLGEPGSPLTVTVHYVHVAGSRSVSVATRVEHTGGEPVDLHFVSSATLAPGRWDAKDSAVHVAGSEWLAEFRWRTVSLAAAGAPDADMPAHGGASPRGALIQLARGTWSTRGALPVGGWERPDGTSLAWQVESGGGWRWQVARSPGVNPGGALELVTSGPAIEEHAWIRTLCAGDVFDTPVTTICWSVDGWDEVAAELTRHHRRTHRAFAGDAGLPLIVNDYMNALMADPTTAKLLPMIDAAADLGGEIFVVDAGWYADDSGWWDTVGAWEASTSRFPGGFGAVFDHIRERGMTPGLWLEPDVIGVRSPAVRDLPPEAFYCRGGVPLVEQGRHRLDFRHPAVIARLDEIVDRLIADYGLGYLKFDDNTDPVAGTDTGGLTPAEGLRASSVAFLHWIDGLHERHPEVLIENCASGGMRADPETMTHFALLSTSDQQNALLVAPIAASAPLIVPPERAGVWTYPAPNMPLGELTVSLASSILRRPILSGRIDLLDAARRSLVIDAVVVHRRLRHLLPTLLPVWPAGLPAWDDPWIVSGLAGEEAVFLTVVRRGGADTFDLPLDGVLSSATNADILFPAGGEAVVDARDGMLRVALDTPSAVVVRVS